MQEPRHNNYDVVIVGGAMYGSSVAWWLTENTDFDGSILVVEKDPTYEFTSTAHTNSCMRQQFSAVVNIKISQFAADFVKRFRDYMGGDPRVPVPCSIGGNGLPENAVQNTCITKSSRWSVSATRLKV